MHATQYRHSTAANTGILNILGVLHAFCKACKAAKANVLKNCTRCRIANVVSISLLIDDGAEVELPNHQTGLQTLPMKLLLLLLVFLQCTSGPSP